MLLTSDRRKSEIIDSLVEQLGARLKGADSERAQQFVRAYFRGVAPEDLAERDPLDLRCGPGPAALGPAAPARRGQAAGLQSAARAAWLAVDPHGGRDRQRRHAVFGRQRLGRVRAAWPEHPSGDPP